jgi:hypothetical protein
LHDDARRARREVEADLKKHQPRPQQEHGGEAVGQGAQGAVALGAAEHFLADRHGAHGGAGLGGLPQQGHQLDVPQVEIAHPVVAAHLLH